MINPLYEPTRTPTFEEGQAIGRALQEQMGRDARSMVQQHAMLREYADEQYPGDKEVAHNIDVGIAQDFARLRQLQDLRDRYVIDPMFDAETYLRHAQEMFDQEQAKTEVPA